MSVRPLDQGRLPGWGHRGPPLGPLGRRPLEKWVVAVCFFVEEEEEETREEVDQGHPCWSMAAARARSCCWAHRSSIENAAAAAAEAAAEAAATAATAVTAAAAWRCVFVGLTEPDDGYGCPDDDREEEEKEE